MLEGEELTNVLLRITCLNDTKDVLVEAKRRKACWSQDVRRGYD